MLAIFCIINSFLLFKVYPDTASFWFTFMGAAQEVKEPDATIIINAVIPMYFIIFITAPIVIYASNLLGKKNTTKTFG